MIANPKLKKPEKMTPQEYLDWEEKQPIKYEYLNRNNRQSSIVNC